MPTMTSIARTAGLVLAGGRSSRFGSEKAAAVLGGVTLLDRALAHLGDAAPKAVSARAGSRAETIARAAGAVVLQDAEGDAAGPLAGIKAGLIWAPAEFLAVEPCDVPRLPADLHARLMAAIGDAPAAYAQTGDGPQPLCGLWRAAALPLLEAAMAGGEHPSVWRFLDGVGGVRVRFEEAAAFRNINTPADLA